MQVAGEVKGCSFWPWCGLISLGQLRNYTRTKPLAVKQKAAFMEIKAKVHGCDLSTGVLSPTL